MNPHQQPYPYRPAPKTDVGKALAIAIVIIVLLCCGITGIGAIIWNSAPDTSSDTNTRDNDQP